MSSKGLTENLLNMPNLDTDELVERAKRAVGTPEEKSEANADEDPRLKEEYPFVLRYTDGRGTLWTGPFLTKILDIGEQQSVAVLQASFGGGMPVAALTQQQQLVNEAAAHMSISLTKRPSWAKDLRKLKDPEVLFAIYEEVVAHIRVFRGLPIAPSQGGEGA